MPESLFERESTSSWAYGVEEELGLPLIFNFIDFICPKVKSENYNLNEPLDFDF